MRPLIVKQLEYGLTPVAGLALVGHHLKRLSPVFDQFDRALPVRTGVKTSGILRSYLGLLVQGKSDFDAIENFRGDTFFKQSLGIELLASSVTLRQRLDARAADLFDHVAELAARRDTDPAAQWEQSHRGKRVTMWQEAVRIEGVWRPVRRVLRLIEPEFQLDGWTTSLSEQTFSGQDIIAMYADHGTHEQFHSAFKTDLDLERLPSGKFDTNYVVCGLAALAMNILRLLGQAGLHGPDAPVRRPAKRRRLKTVMQELVYRAGRLIEHGRRLILGLGANDRAAKAFTRVHGELFATCG